MGFNGFYFFGGVGGGCFEGEARNWTRITIGVEAHMLEDALERLKGFCTRHTKKTDTETESPSSVENE